MAERGDEKEGVDFAFRFCSIVITESQFCFIHCQSLFQAFVSFKNWPGLVSLLNDVLEKWEAVPNFMK